MRSTWRRCWRYWRQAASQADRELFEGVLLEGRCVIYAAQSTRRIRGLSVLHQENGSAPGTLCPCPKLKLVASTNAKPDRCGAEHCHRCWLRGIDGDRRKAGSRSSLNKQSSRLAATGCSRSRCGRLACQVICCRVAAEGTGQQQIQSSGGQLIRGDAGDVERYCVCPVGTLDRIAKRAGRPTGLTGNVHSM